MNLQAIAAFLAGYGVTSVTLEDGMLALTIRGEDDTTIYTQDEMNNALGGKHE